MCGIVGAVCERDVYGILIEGLKRLEYRGYDSAGLSLLNKGNINTQKTIGKVVDLENLFGESLPSGTVGIAHTRWATHGVPSSINSHPHTSGPISVVHNGIIENHNELRKEITEQGIKFSSNTDSEVIAHLINLNVCTSNSFREAVTKALLRLDGAYAICVISKDDPGKIIGARSGSPLVVGLGIGENFMASDQMALRQVTDRFVYLEEGDVAEVTKEDFSIFNQDGVIVERDVTQINEVDQSSEKGEYKHFMEKEIYEQPEAVINTLNGRVSGDDVLDNYDDYSLLIMKNGGENLKQFAEKMHNMAKNDHNQRKMENFWIECHRLFKGVYEFLENDIIHHDLKPQNIVFNEENFRLNFIDFGLMQKKSKIRSTLNYKGEYWLTNFHWSYPLEIGFLNKSYYRLLLGKYQQERKKMIYEILKIEQDPKLFQELMAKRSYKAKLAKAHSVFLNQCFPNSIRKINNKHIGDISYLDMDFSQASNGYFREPHHDKNTRIINFLLYISSNNL